MSPGPEDGGHRPGRGLARWLVGVGALVAATGSAMYLLPGPGLPLLATGVVFLLGGAILWSLGRRWR